MPLPLNPVLTRMRDYPFARLTAAKAEAAARGVDLVDLGVGEPREETPAFIRRALAEAVDPRSSYPLAAGLPELREAIARWAERRTGAALDPETEVVPTLGSKEAIFALAQVVGDPAGGRDLVAVTTPGYPVPARGARFAGLDVVELPLRAERDWLPDPDALDPAVLDRLALLWLNSPNNPTGAVADAGLLERLAALARRHGFVLASDEAYSEIWLEGDAPASALALPDRRHVLVLNTLSKRSSMPGYRSGFAAGDPDLVAALRRFRPMTGTAPQAFVQRAAVAAWDDEEHVVAVRERYRAKRDALLPALEAAGLRHVGGRGTFFLWLALPEGARDDEAVAGDLLDRGVVVTPGSYLGPGGEGHLRAALVPSPEDCARAARRLDGWRPHGGGAP